jgi:HK97 family phage prohead protease
MTRRTFRATAKAVSTGVYDVTLSTSNLDREQDRINVNGWQVHGAPPLLWQHDANQLPLGRVSGLHVEGDALRGRMTFTPRGMNPFADKVADLIAAGFLTSVSVGFRPLEAPKLNTDGGYTYTKQELLELSVVNVPAHPEARIEADMVAVAKWFAGGDEEVAVIVEEEVAVVIDDTKAQPEIRISEAAIEKAVREAVTEALNRATGRLD